MGMIPHFHTFPSFIRVSVMPQSVALHAAVGSSKQVEEDANGDPIYSSDLQQLTFYDNSIGIYWHSIWLIYSEKLFWYSLIFYLTDILTFSLTLYLAYVLTFYLAFYLAFHLTYIRTYRLTFYATFSQPLYLKSANNILSKSLSCYPVSHMTHMYPDIPCTWTDILSGSSCWVPGPRVGDMILPTWPMANGEKQPARTSRALRTIFFATLGMLILKVSELFTFWRWGWESLVSATTEASQASLSISLIIYVGLGPQSRVGCPAMIGSPTAPQRWFRSRERTGCLSGKPSCTLARTPHLCDVYKYQAHHTRLLRRKETPKPRDWLVIFSRCHWTYPRIASSLLGCQPSPGDSTSPKTAPKGYMAWD